MAVEQYPAPGASDAQLQSVTNTINAVSGVVSDITGQVAGAMSQLQQAQAASVSAIPTGYLSGISSLQKAASTSVGQVTGQLATSIHGQLSQAGSYSALAAQPSQQTAPIAPLWMVWFFSGPATTTHNADDGYSCLFAEPFYGNIYQPNIFSGTLQACEAFMASKKDLQGRNYVQISSSIGVALNPSVVYGPIGSTCGAPTTTPTTTTQPIGAPIGAAIGGIVGQTTQPITTTIQPTTTQPLQISPAPSTTISPTIAPIGSLISSSIPQTQQPSIPVTTGPSVATYPITEPEIQPIPQPISPQCPPPIVNCNCPSCGQPITVKVEPTITVKVRKVRRRLADILEKQDHFTIHSDGSWDAKIFYRNIPEFEEIVTNTLERIASAWEEELTEEDDKSGGTLVMFDDFSRGL